MPSVDDHKNHTVLPSPLFCPNEELLDSDSSQSYPDPIDQDHGCSDVIPKENQEKTQDVLVCGEMEERGSKRKKLVDECNSHMRNLGSILWLLPENALLELEKDLLDLGKKMLNLVDSDDSSD